jgi:4-hydroxy-3-polyprenylbenzoate decarboxylase
MRPTAPRDRVALLVTGASGMLLPQHVLKVLADHPGIRRLHLVVSAGASQVMWHEMEQAAGQRRTGAEDLLDLAGLSDPARAKVEVHRDNDLGAAIASGSYPLAGTAVLPCSAGTLGALASGSARTLVHRAGAVALKERWPLVLGFRETPLSLVHIENLRRLTYAGAVVLPPIPAFYIGGSDMERFLDHYALRLLDQLGIPAPGAPGLRWKIDPL